MPAQESIHEYYLQQHHTIENYLGVCMVHADPESVHELRLGIKKLRAFHKLAEEFCLANVDEHIRIKNRVRRLFRIAGQLRDTQVQIQLLGSMQEATGMDYPLFGKWLLKREQKRNVRLQKKPLHLLSHNVDDKPLSLISDWLAVASDETVLSCSAKVLNDLYSRATELAAGNLNNSDLHRVRSLAKKVKYILNILDHSYPEFVYPEISPDALREIESYVGHWHDALVRVELLQKFIGNTQFRDHRQKSKYNLFVEACKAELETSYAEACRVVRNELSATTV